MELLADRRQSRCRLKFRNRCDHVPAFKVHLSEIVMRVSIPWAELNGDAKLFKRLLFFSLLTQCFPKSAVDVRNFGMRLL